MGAKASKIEGSYLPDTPTLNKLRILSDGATDDTPAVSENELKDPRSPAPGCRTPLTFLQQQAQQPKLEVVSNINENAFAQLRKRLLKGFSTNDPRSPQLNRTPLIFDEAIDRTLNMDDTFADLFVDTRAPIVTTELRQTPVKETETLTSAEIEVNEPENDNFIPMEMHNNSSVEIMSLPYEEEETMACDAKLEKTSATPECCYDPRSPSIGVERTPIIFCDDETDEVQMLEQILETLTMNLSNESSMVSVTGAPADVMDIMDTEPQPRLANKHLERVRLGKMQRVPPRKPARASKSQTPQRIYIDMDMQESVCSTPKKSSQLNSGTKRTPLSCVKNKQHLRSRSVEKELRKTRLPLQSYDDQLNPRECTNVTSLRILSACGNDLDALLN